jgi:hypothetical protein
MVASMAAMAAGAFQRSNQAASNGFTEQRLPAHRGRARQICEATVGCRQSSWDRRNLTSSLRGANRFETMPLLDGRVSSRVEQRIRLPVTSIVSNGGSHFVSGLRLLMLTRMVPLCRALHKGTYVEDPVMQSVGCVRTFGRGLGLNT